MSITGLLIALGGFAVLLVFIAAPLWERKRASEPMLDVISPLDELNTAYNRIKSTLRDLDEDHALGKLDDDAYAVEREHWVSEGARVLAAIDRVKAQG